MYINLRNYIHNERKLKKTIIKLTHLLNEIFGIKKSTVQRYKKIIQYNAIELTDKDIYDYKQSKKNYRYYYMNEKPLK